MNYKIIKSERVYSGFFKMDKITVSHELFNGVQSQEKAVEVFERGDSSAALIYETDTKNLLFTNQFRLPVAEKDGGWIMDLVAGAIDENESPAESIRREIEEEIGYHVLSLILLYKFYVSPGGSSERIFLFYAETKSTEKKFDGGGKHTEGEDIQLIKIPVSEIENILNEIKDAKTLIAVQWFLINRGRL